MSKTNELPHEVSAGAFAELVGLSDRRIRQLVGEHGVVRSSRGRIVLAPSVQGMLAGARAAREQNPLNEARTRAADTRAALAQLRLQREAGNLIAVDDAMSVVDAVAGCINELLAGLPARLGGRDLAERERIERAVDAMRDDLIEQLQRERRTLHPKL